MITKAQAKKLRRLIGAFADAQEADSWKGSSDAESIPEIEEDLTEARKALNEFLKSITEKPAT